MQELKYKIVYGAFYALSLLPFALLYSFATLLCPIIYHVVKYRRGIVRKNLLNSFPDKTLREIKEIEREFYRFFCNYFVETIKLMSISNREMKRRMTFSGVAGMEEALKDHDFCFVFLGHYGNWEWMSTLPLWVDKGIQCAQIYHPLRNKMFDRFFLSLRAGFGGENIPKNNTLRRIVSMRKEGKKAIIGFISDQTPKQISIHDWVDFLNQETGIFTGTERIAKQVDAAVFYGEMKIKGRGRYHCSFSKISTDIKSFEDFKATEIYMQLLEATICAAPPYWLWTHNRWKRKRPSGPVVQTLT